METSRRKRTWTPRWRSRTAVRRLTGREGGGRQVRSKRAELRSRAGNPIPEPGNKAKGTQPFLFSGFPHRVAGALRPSPPHAVSLRAFGLYAESPTAGGGRVFRAFVPFACPAVFVGAGAPFNRCRAVPAVWRSRNGPSPSPTARP